MRTPIQAGPTSTTSAPASIVGDPHTRRRGACISIAAVAWLAALVFMAGCDTITGSGSSTTPPPQITELPRALTSAELQAIDASNRFGFDLLRQVVNEDPSASVFLSPFSASMALGMTLNGADGATFDAMRATLRFEGLSEEEINTSYRDLLDLLTDLDPDVELAVGNSVWHRQDVLVRGSFRERVEAYFDARVEGLDFASPTAAPTINAWVRDATQGRIEEIVDDPIDPNVVAFLINAVFFKAGWTDTFDPDRTRAEPFHLPDGSTETVDLMVRDDTLSFHATERYHAVDLPYAGQAYSMTVVVPRGRISVHDLVADLDETAWAELTDGFRTTRAQLWLPRFELEWEGVLNDMLEAMGMGIAFQPGADFTRMFENAAPWIDEVKQKSFVRVDEEGTEAAAVTSVSMVASLPPQVRADRPFLFAIRERLSGTILFLGVIVEPPPRI